MPKVGAPLFSVTAKGMLGDVLCYQGGPSGGRVTVKPAHRDMKSAAQLSNRSSYLSACSYWNGLNEHEQMFYEYLGDQIGMTGFNYCVAQYMLGIVS